MITEQQEKTATRILNTLEKQVFALWYQSGRFERYISGEAEQGRPNHVSKKDILEDIVKKFGITEKGTIE